MLIAESSTWGQVMALVAAGVGGVVVTLGTGLRGVLQSYLDRWKKRVDQRTLGLAFERWLAIIYAVNQLEDHPEVDRAVLFSGKDGGGLPSVGKDYTIQGRHALCKDGDCISYLSRYNYPIQVDAELVSALADLAKPGVGMSIQTKAAMKPSLLLDMMQRDKLAQMRLFYLGTEEDRMLFLAASRLDSNGEFTPEGATTLRLEVDRIKGAFHQ